MEKIKTQPEKWEPHSLVGFFYGTYITKINNKNHLQEWVTWTCTHSYTLKLEWRNVTKITMLAKRKREREKIEEK